MNTLPNVHLCVIQPLGFIHALGFLDQALYLRHQFERMGAQVSLAKNRLKHDAINIVLGAHLGFDRSLLAQYDCLILNLEQIGDGGAQVSDDYLALLSHAPVIDYDLRNVRAYSSHPDDVPLISFLNAPYLQAEAPALETRPIDLLFFGSVNERRKRWFDRIEACGLKIASFDGPVYGPERDAFIQQAKAVLNCHFYETSRFEQARAFTCLSLGTPLISERGRQTFAPAAYEETVSWIDEDSLADFFQTEFGSAEWFDRSRAQLDAFSLTDPIEHYADVLAFAAGYRQARGRGHRPTPRQIVRQVHIGSGKDYKLGWFNVDILDKALPDAVLDLSGDLSFPLDIDSPQVGPVRLAAGEVEMIYANNVLEHVPDLPALMTNCLSLLKLGGDFVIEVPHERARTAWQDPTHVRALNENSWLYYTDWFWYLGWFEHRFSIAQSTYLDERLAPCGADQAAFMKLTLRKVETTLHERMVARTMRADFGPDIEAGSNEQGLALPDPQDNAAHPGVSTLLRSGAV